MKLFTSIAALIILTATVPSSAAEPKMPDMPKPTAEHAWLQQLVGDWDAQTEAYFEPGKAPIKTTGQESVKAIGDFWTATHVKSEMMGKPFIGTMTLGYDPKKGKYVGTWVDSMTSKLWEYEGTVDESGKVLTLTSEGECPCTGKTTKFQESVELKDANHKVFTSKMLVDGNWVTTMVSTATRK
jgi:Protein of unknown function (DUF1579)